MGKVWRRCGEAVEAPNRIAAGAAPLWKRRPVVNRQVTPLSTFYAQAARQKIAAVRGRTDPACSPVEVDIRDLAVDWQQDAACVYHREVDFFPARGESVRDAKAVCACCPVRVECLDFALRLKVAHGVWGGLSERERRSLRRERHRATLGDHGR